MKFNAPDHFSHSFELKLDTLPTKKSDRIALSILYPGLFFGAILVLLGVYELFNGFKHGSSAFDDISPDATVAFEPLISPWLFDSVIIVIGLGIIFSLILSYIRYKKIFFDGKTVEVVHRPAFGDKKGFKDKLENYEGVRFRIEFFQFGFLNKNKYIIELYHKNHNKTVPLYISTSDKNIRRLPVSDGVQLHLVVAHQLPQLCNVEGRKPCTAGNQDRLSGFASRQLVFAVLLDRKVVRVAGFQLIEHDIHWVLEGLIVLSGF